MGTQHRSFGYGSYEHVVSVTETAIHQVFWIWFRSIQKTSQV
jgi:hypothetical protein